MFCFPRSVVGSASDECRSGMKPVSSLSGLMVFPTTTLGRRFLSFLLAGCWLTAESVSVVVDNKAQFSSEGLETASLEQLAHAKLQPGVVHRVQEAQGLSPVNNEFSRFSKDVRFHEEPRRFALLIPGTLRRFNSNADTHVVAPLIGENWEVDVFLSLFDGPSRGWTSVSDNFQQDPQFDGLNRSGIQSAIERRFSMPGSRLVVDKIFDDHHETSEDIAFVKGNKFWPDSHGPGQGRFARRNFILLLKELENLWYRALLQEDLLGPYSYVMILRDDAFWFQDFNLNRLLGLGGVERTLASSTNKGHLYSMMCKNIPDPLGIIDYVFLLDRSAAETFGKCYSRLVHPAHFGHEWLAKYEHNEVGQNSEHFYFILAKFAEIQVIDVPTSLLPMQRTAWLDGRMCLHKYCDSDVKSKDVQQRKPDMPLCSGDVGKYGADTTITVLTAIMPIWMSMM
eukprot:Skav232529  [mRNA]  locus=scaffold319:33354:38059:+ [translate_table: standard]